MTASLIAASVVYHIFIGVAAVMFFRSANEARKKYSENAVSFGLDGKEWKIPMKMGAVIAQALESDKNPETLEQVSDIVAADAGYDSAHIHIHASRSDSAPDEDGGDSPIEVTRNNTFYSITGNTRAVCDACHTVVRCPVIFDMDEIATAMVIVPLSVLNGAEGGMIPVSECCVASILYPNDPDLDPNDSDID